jgi:hypothetical protein
VQEIPFAVHLGETQLLHLESLLREMCAYANELIGLIEGARYASESLNDIEVTQIATAHGVQCAKLRGCRHLLLTYREAETSRQSQHQLDAWLTALDSIESSARAGLNILTTDEKFDRR